MKKQLFILSLVYLGISPSTPAHASIIENLQKGLALLSGGVDVAAKVPDLIIALFVAKETLQTEYDKLSQLIAKDQTKVLTEEEVLTLFNSSVKMEEKLENVLKLVLELVMVFDQKIIMVLDKDKATDLEKVLFDLFTIIDNMDTINQVLKQRLQPHLQKESIPIHLQKEFIPKIQIPKPVGYKAIL